MIRHRKIVVAATEMSTGGLGSYLVMLMTELKSRGWSVYLLVTNQRGDLYEKLEESFVCHDLSSISLSRKKVAIAVNLLNGISPEILLMNHVSLLHYALPLLRSDIKTVAVLHSDDARFYKISTLFARRIFRWIAPAPRLADQCANYLSPELSYRMRVVPHGVREDVFCPDKKENNKPFKKISFVGFLGKTKGADLLPDIMLRVLGSCPDVRLNLIGDGPLRSRLEHRLQESGLLDRCDFAGGVSREIVAHHLRESDILLLPTRLEGFGLTIVEAMMSGAVPTVSRLPGITDFIVNDGVTGFLVEQEDIKGFAETIINLVNNPECLKSMSMAARRDATERFSEKRMIDSYEALFAETDDRGTTPCQGTIGWISEAMGEIITRGIERKWLLRRVLELWN